MHLKVYWRDRHENTCHSADRKSDDEPQKPKHGCCELNASAEHRKEPVEDFNPGGNRDDHRHDAKERVDICSGPHRKEVVQPNDKGEEGNRDHRPYHRGITKQPFMGKNGDDLGEDPKCR